MERHCEALVLGIGNVLWADERFGVRAVEALHAAYAFPSVVVLKDGGTLGLNLYDSVASARRVLVFDAIDVRREPGTLIVLRGAEVPAWGRTRLSPHQPGFNDVLALARLNGRAPETIVAIGAQPRALSDFGGSLTECVRKRLPRRPGARRAGVGAMGLPRQAAARRKPFRAAQRALACARRLRIRTAVCRGGVSRV